MVAQFSKLDVAPAYRQVHDAIEHRIVAGSLRSGDLLPAEATLAEQFGVNRSTIREGIRLLEQSGLVERVGGGKRLRVSLPHYQDLASRASRAMVMHQITFRELWEASIALEATTVSLAAERITPEQLKALEENVAAMERATADDSEFIRFDIAFHNMLAEAASNRALALAREPISLLFFPAGKVILPRLKTHHRVIQAHRAVLNALKAGDQQEAYTWMRRHMADFRRAYERTGIDLDQPLDLAMTQASSGG